MTKSLITIVAIALLSGCAMGVETVKDLSTGEETALIDGGDPSIIAKDGTCHIIWPIVANWIVVDAGPVTFVEYCSARDNGSLPPGPNWHHAKAVFQFDAKAGNTYEIRRGKCMQLVNVTARDHTVACEPHFVHGFKDLSTGDDTAVVRSGIGDTPWDYCGPTREEKPFGFLFIDAGSTTVDVTCKTTGNFESRWKSSTRIWTTSFDFDAQSGHTYAFSKADEECIRLLDITSGEAVIACEPSKRQADFIRGETPVNPNRALIKAGGASRNKGDCEPSTGGRRGRKESFEVDAGPVSIDGECQAKILPDFLGQRRRLSSFEFVAEAGHTYTVSAIEKECMSLLDITAEEFVIACEPYRKSE